MRGMVPTRWPFYKIRQIRHKIAAASLLLPGLVGAADQLADTTQLIVVTAKGWDSSRGVLERYERLQRGTPWRLVGMRVPVLLGRNGLAWGEGEPIRKPQQGPVKIEGDKRSPAGLFRIGPVYGAAPDSDPAVARLRMPYRRIAPGLECVDDPGSEEYNRIVMRPAQGAAAWRSAEKMAELAVREYKWLAVVQQNPGRKPGQGSCVFLHVGNPRSAEAAGTGGCTALEEDDLTDLLAWLDVDRRPVLVQLPAASYTRITGPDATPLDLPERMQ